MVHFVSRLKSLLGKERRVIWYDALNSDNEVQYQNGLTHKNVDFALAADAIFTNYKWTKRELENAKQIARSHSMDAAKVYFGVDVWAQNTDMLGSPRITYPPNHGGGTMTGVVRMLSQRNFSIANLLQFLGPFGR